MGPRDVFERFRQNVLDGEVGLTPDLCAEDVVVEMPFAAEGFRRVEGRETFAAFARQGREALAVRFEEFRDVAVHETGDPDTIVAEYELTGVAGEHRASASFVLVLTTRDGKVVRWREYQDTAAIARALA
ncbi:nuclear transport factor 2 family protein [Spirillospora sp. NPDC047279]|uniref:nuclear transport factor 2 family protein n=1 Tax=Spirillospora sp. NPDC047279 TaxID=3155478 RepID=UPI0033D04747